MNEELIVWQIGLIISILINCLMILLIFWGGKILWKFLKVKILRRNGYVWDLRVFNDATVDLGFNKLEKEIKYSKKGDNLEPDVSIVAPLIHHERTTNIPMVISVEGNVSTADLRNVFLSNRYLLEIFMKDKKLREALLEDRVLLNEFQKVSINRGFPPSELARLSDQNNVRALNTGILIGQNFSLKNMFNNPLIIIFAILVLVGIGVAVFYGFQNAGDIAKMKTVLDGISTAVSNSSVVVGGGK
jgi:hypothetical protein